MSLSVSQATNRAKCPEASWCTYIPIGRLRTKSSVPHTCYIYNWGLLILHAKLALAGLIATPVRYRPRSGLVLLRQFVISGGKLFALENWTTSIYIVVLRVWCSAVVRERESCLKLTVRTGSLGRCHFRVILVMYDLSGGGNYGSVWTGMLTAMHNSQILNGD